jgi:addiction module HigA family antidote
MHPGALIADVLPATGKTILDAADLMGISRQMLSQIIHGRARVTPDVAHRLGKLFGNGPDLWLTLQAKWDAEHNRPPKRQIARIPTLRAVA